MRNYITITITALLALFTSCDKSILGHEPSADNPEEIFETLWQDFDEHYALFGVRSVNWDSLYSVYRPMVTKDISQDSLWGVCTSMMSHFNDRHTAISQINGDEKYFNTGHHLVSHTYYKFYYTFIMNELEADFTVSSDFQMLYGKIVNKDMGYLHLRAMDYYTLSDLNTALDKITQYNSLILDLRQNSGGMPEPIFAIVRRFSDNEDLVYNSQTRSGPNHDDFNPKLSTYNVKSDNPYKGQVVVLTDRATMSAAEWVLLSLRTCDNVTHIGDTTSGCISPPSPTRLLPNNWRFWYSVQKATLPDGSTHEGVGITPDIYVVNDEDDIKINQKDAVLRRAMDYLSN